MSKMLYVLYIKEHDHICSNLKIYRDEEHTNIVGCPFYGSDADDMLYMLMDNDKHDLSIIVEEVQPNVKTVIK